MAKFVKRWVETHYGLLSTAYFLRGDNPKPAIFIDDIEGVYYELFMEDHPGERRYKKRSLGKITYG